MNPTHHTCPDCGYAWKHGEHGGHSCVARLKDALQRLRDGARRLDNQMRGNELYEHGWANYPKEPAKSPRRMLMELLLENERDLAASPLLWIKVSDAPTIYEAQDGEGFRYLLRHEYAQLWCAANMTGKHYRRILYLSSQPESRTAALARVHDDWRGTREGGDSE